MFLSPIFFSSAAAVHHTPIPPPHWIVPLRAPTPLIALPPCFAPTPLIPCLLFILASHKREKENSQKKESNQKKGERKKQKKEQADPPGSRPPP